MSKVLKLVGLKTYINAHTKGALVKKNETCRFDDAVADKVLKGERNGKEEGDTAIPYWEEQDADANVVHDFTKDPAATVAKTVAMEDDGAPKIAPRKSAVRQRA